jgi:alkylhydroperoxidase/carboxymuconolactone decarboxylase family protein YurZ
MSTRKDDVRLAKKIDFKELPESLRRFVKSYPAVWSAHERLGIETARAGPLSERDIQLIKLAVSASQGMETSFKTHVEKALRSGASEAEIEHAIVQLLPMIGMGKMMTAMKWYRERRKRRQP